MAKTWPAYNKWQYAKAGHIYLSKIFDDDFVTVFQDDAPISDSTDTYKGFSFN